MHRMPKVAIRRRSRRRAPAAHVATWRFCSHLATRCNRNASWYQWVDNNAGDNYV
jgi:hypothetical protein